MKVLLITSTTKQTSGWGRLSSDALRALKKIGHEVTVISEDDTAQFQLKKRNGVYSWLYNIALVWRESRKVEVVHAFDVWPYGVYAYFALFFSRTRLVMNGIGTYSLPPFRVSFKSIVMKLAIRSARHIYCISNYTEERIKERVPTAHTEVVLMGAPHIQKLSKEEAAHFEEKYKLEGHYPIVLTVGEIKSRKGQRDTAEAVALLSHTYPDILYCVLGSDRDTPYVESIKKVGERIGKSHMITIVADAKDDKALSYFYDKATLFALNSNNEGDHFEGFGLVILEANAFGKPAIGSTRTGIESAIVDGYNGLLTKQADPQDIASKMIFLLEKESYALFSQQALLHYKKFTWEKTAEGYTKGYKD